MIYKASTFLTEKLLSLPETGMGYQIISAKRQGSISPERFVVYNSQLVINDDVNFERFKNQIRSEGVIKIFNKINFLSLESPVLVNKAEYRNLRKLSDSQMNYKGRHYESIGAKDSSPIHANGKDYFIRLSAWEDDKRIDFDNMKLKIGSYTTTYEDYLSCRSNNDEPIDRYALPTEDEIKFAFYIKPATNDQYKPGVVQPAFNHNGGGIEDLFDNGTSNQTYIQRLPY
jgi:hypothetical protein